LSISHKLARQFVEKFELIKNEKGSDLSIGDIDGLFKHLKGEHEEKLFEGIHNIAGKLSSIKIEVADPLPNMSEGIIPDTNMELDAVVKAAEDATNTILDSAEKIQNIVTNLDEDKSTIILEEITKIFEACNFQDISGQRINNVVNTLMEIETSVNELLAELEGKVTIETKAKEVKAPSDDDLMNGPQLEENTPSQDDIDKLFAGS